MSGDQSATLSWGHTGDSRNLFIPDLMAVFFEEPGSKALVTSSDALVSNSFLLLQVRHLLLLAWHLFLIASCYY